MKAIRLYDWEDTDKQHVLREVRILRADDLTRNGKTRIYAWSEGDNFNYMLYPTDGTAYPEHDNRVQQQRHTERYLYVAIE